MSDDDDDIDPCFVCGSRGGTSGESAEIARLTAALARVTAQRDLLAIDMQNSVIADNVNSGEDNPQADAATWMAKVYGLRIENGKVKEIEGS